MDLAGLEEIKRLKYRYLRCVDTKDWDGLAGVLTSDAVADYGTPTYGKPLKLTGRDAIVGFMREQLGPGLITTHFASQPEIEISGDEATGMWAFQDTVIAVEYGVVIAGAAFYEDRYRREDGQWLIAHTGYQRTYEATMKLADLPSFKLTANRWASVR
jgi:hypothetical protein